MDAAAMTFAIGVNATLEEGGDEVHLPIATKTLPVKAENAARVRNLPFCTKRTLDNDDVGHFLSSGFFINVRESTSFGRNLWKVWAGAVDDDWKRHASAKDDQVKAGAKGTREDAMFNVRAWLWRHRQAMADRWDWSRAAELMVCGTGWMRVPRKEAPSFRELREGGYENRYLPIAH
jgi:hypothetical protein